MATFNEQLYISAMYVAGYDRAPDLNGFNFWQAQLPGPPGEPTQAQKITFSEGFTSHPAFTTLYGDLSNNAFVQAIYQNVLGQGGDGPGVVFWTTYLVNHTRAEFLTAFVESALFIDVNSTNYPNLTPEQLEVAQQRQDFLANKANVGIYFATELGTDSNLSPTTDANSLASLNQDPAYVAAQAILNGVTNIPSTAVDANNLIDDAAALSNPATPANEAADYIIANAPDGPVIPGQNLNYTTAIDRLVGGGGDDTFTGTIDGTLTGDTLQTGDTADGNGGNDTVVVTISGAGAVLTGINTTEIETIKVQALTAHPNGSTLDLSNTQNVTTLWSNQTDGAQLTFSDIQTVDTDLKIVDTDETHNFIYDLNAYHATANTNIADLNLQEIRGAAINFGDKDEPVGQSQVSEIDITSEVRPGTPVSPANNNLITELNVGGVEADPLTGLQTVVIDGDANLKVNAPLDINISRVDAGALDANLWLDMSESNDGDEAFKTDPQTGNITRLADDKVKEIIYIGANHVNNASVPPADPLFEPWNDHINFGTTNNAKQVRLGTGDDWVTTGTGVASVDGGDGNDTIITGALNDLVIGGNGNDTVTDAGADNSLTNTVTVDDKTYTFINYSLGGNRFDMGAGDDSVLVSGNANNTVLGGAGNDVININGIGVHNIDLGAAEDVATNHNELTITRSGDIDAFTIIKGGAGVDTVVIDTLERGQDGALISTDHRLNADLGAGNDSITLRADDIENDDIVLGGAGTDTMVFTNHDGLIVPGMIQQSETQQVRGFEVFDLRDENIYFNLTDNLIVSAEGRSVTVKTDTLDASGKSQLTTGTQTVDITALTAPDSFFTLHGGINQDIVVADDSTVNSFSTLRYDSSFGIILNPDGTVKSNSNSIEDTLVIVDGATVRHGDLRNVTGLEHIELTASNNDAQAWRIELDSTIINQTTSTAPFVIRVDSEVPAGSALYITTDGTVVNADSNVRIIRNSNVEVFLNGSLVTEPQFGDKLISFAGDKGLFVTTALDFTTNPDNLVGTDDPDLFTATSLDQLQSGDSAFGNGGLDTLLLDKFAVANPNLSLFDQFGGGVTLDSIERIEFNTGNNVMMRGIGYADVTQLATDQGNDTLQNMELEVSYELGAGNDYIGLQDDLSIGQIPLIVTTVDGGLGLDMVHVGFGEDGNSEVLIQNVEYVTDDETGDFDSVRLNQAGSQAVAGLVVLNNIENINGSSGNDNILAGSDNGQINLNANEGDDTVVVGFTPIPDGANHIHIDTPLYNIVPAQGVDIFSPSFAAVLGGAGKDTLTVSSNNVADVWGDNGDISVGQDDTITVTAPISAVFGNGGNDTITVSANNGFVLGQDGNDTITLTTTGANAQFTVDGGIGNDTITITSDSDALVTIIGAAGNDTITITNSVGIDTLQFGNIDYSATQTLLSDTQGTDAITGYNWEAFTDGDAAPVNQDIMDFSEFLGGSPIGNYPASNAVVDATGYWDHSTTVVANGNAGNSLVVLSGNHQTLSSVDFSVNLGGTIQLNDNARAVVVLGTDGTGADSGIDNFNIYFVQDIDTTGTGQTWQVDLAATVDSLTLVGVQTVFENLANNYV